MHYTYLPDEPNFVKDCIGEPVTPEQISRRIAVKNMLIKACKADIRLSKMLIAKHTEEIRRLNRKANSEKDRSSGNP
jgi:hypothetical protein